MAKLPEGAPESVQGRASPRGTTIRCVCGKTHRMTPTALAVALQAFINGDAQRVDVQGVSTMCIVELLDNAPASALQGKRLQRIDYE